MIPSFIGQIFNDLSPSVRSGHFKGTKRLKRRPLFQGFEPPEPSLTSCIMFSEASGSSGSAGGQGSCTCLRACRLFSSRGPVGHRLGDCLELGLTPQPLSPPEC